MLWDKLRHLLRLVSDEPIQPCSESEIFEAERLRGRMFHPSQRQLFLEVGKFSWRERLFDSVNVCAPLHVARMEIQAETDIVVLSSTSTEVRPVGMTAKRSALAYSDYHRFFLDEEPLPSGRVGQVVCVDVLEESIFLLEESVDALLARAIACLEIQLNRGYPYDTVPIREG